MGGTPLVLPNSPLPPSENALAFLVASPPSLVQAPGATTAFGSVISSTGSHQDSSRMPPARGHSLQWCPRPVTLLPCLFWTESSRAIGGTQPEAVRFPHLWSVKVPGSQSLLCILCCWGQSSVLHVHQIELYFYQSAKCKAVNTLRVGVPRKTLT